jgi:hypothetical protein
MDREKILNNRCKELGINRPELEKSLLEAPINQPTIKPHKESINKPAIKPKEPKNKPIIKTPKKALRKFPSFLDDPHYHIRIKDNFTGILYYSMREVSKITGIPYSRVRQDVLTDELLFSIVKIKIV